MEIGWVNASPWLVQRSACTSTRPFDMSTQMMAATGAICRLSLSFNNEGPLGTFFRYTCDNGTWVARYDDLIDGKEPNAGVGQVLPCYRALAELDRQLAAQASSVRN